jgi:hypothetical protein
MILGAPILLVGRQHNLIGSRRLVPRFVLLDPSSQGWHAAGGAISPLAEVACKSALKDVRSYPLRTARERCPSKSNSAMNEPHRTISFPAVKGILREYPTTSIRNHTARLFGYNIWHDLQLYVGGTPYSLDQIEHKVLRKMREPRIHLATVCASKG